MKKILLVDDDKLICESLKIILENKGYDVVAVANDGNEGYELYKKEKPDLVLMDIRMKYCNGIESSEKILKEYPTANILLLTTFKDEEYISKAITNGIKGYILKDNFSSLIPSIETVLSGNMVFDKEVIINMSKIKKQDKLLGDFTQREMDIIELVAKGMNNREISEKLFLSEGTVRNYLSVILEKLDLRDRTQLAIYYLNQLNG
ncbi:MAG: response regulator transcription factor [Tissierellia bacterium]|nr:response regulator transcription factor [Tissierellia bacterium]